MCIDTFLNISEKVNKFRHTGFNVNFNFVFSNVKEVLKKNNVSICLFVVNVALEKKNIMP